MAFFSRPQSASAAVKIVDPSTHPGSPQQVNARSPRKDTSQRQCRNIVLYGSCKFQDKGCIYNHPSPTPVGPSPPLPQTPKSPTTTPSISADAVHAPVFVPKGTPVLQASAGPPSPLDFNSRRSSDSSSTPPSPDYQVPFGYQPQQDVSVHESYNYYEGGEAHVDSLSTSMTELDPRFYDDSQYNSYDPNAKVSYYATPSSMYIREPLNYHLYTPTIPPAFTPSSTDSHFVPPSSDLRQILQSRSEIVRDTMGAVPGLPDDVQGYHTFVNLEMPPGHVGQQMPEKRKILNWFSTVYRAIKATDGIPYALRRIENIRLNHPPAALAAIDMWRKVKHPGIVPIHEAFTTRSFNDSSLVVVYSYYPGAQTLHDVHFKATYLQAAPEPMPERTLWSYIVQIAAAMRKVHESGLAVRALDASKVLVTGKNRVRLSGCGIVDVLLHDQPQQVMYLQQEDLTNFGKLIFAMACSNPTASTPTQFQRSIEFMSRMYSPEVKNAALFLISKGNTHKTIGNFIESFSRRMIIEVDDALDASDRLEHELLSELENARLVRLLCKLGFINERPEFARDPRWSETGDRYIIHLFRDYVFHQVDERGRPVTNLAHVLGCLNKLDAGSDERIMLITRDEQNCLVVSYKDIKACIESAFSELTRPI